jgi:hypothetical protein
MNPRSVLVPALLCAAALSASGVLSAQDSAAPVPGAALPKGHYAQLNKLPDWGGIWLPNFPPRGATRERPQAKGQYLKAYQDWQHQVQTQNGEVKREGSYCRPPGMPGIMAVGQYPIEFLFTPGRVTIHHEAWQQWRSIWTDGRKHPDDWDPTFYGHSIGHWEADTLVVDTVGVKTITEIAPGLKHSDKMRIIERFHLVPGNTDALVDEITVEDPEALEQPWHNTVTFHRSRDMDLLEFICAENDRNPVDASGKTGLE